MSIALGMDAESSWNSAFGFKNELDRNWKRRSVQEFADAYCIAAKRQNKNFFMFPPFFLLTGLNLVFTERRMNAELFYVMGVIEKCCQESSLFSLTWQCRIKAAIYAWA